MKTTTLVATLTTPPSNDGAELAELPSGVGTLEVRADLLGDLDPDWLRDRFAGNLLYTLRSRAEGGSFEGGREARRRRLTAAVESYDLVDLEAERDLAAETLDSVPEDRRLVSWHGTARSLTTLRGRAVRMSATPARYYKLIPAARHEGDALLPLLLLESLRRDDVIAFASGEMGVWTRLVAPRLGSPLVYGALGETPGAPGKPTIPRLIDDFGLPELPPVIHLCGIVGRPVLQSLSPRIHNRAYRALGVPGLYLPFHAESFGDFWLDVVEAEALRVIGLPLHGLSVTAPYKEAALAVAGASSPRADHIGAANTLVWDDGVWEAESTDPEGVTLALEAAGVVIGGARAAVVGCGGAGRAAAYGLEIAGAGVTLVNRNEERGEKAAADLRLPFIPLTGFDPRGFDIVVHATSLGHRDDDEPAFAIDRLHPGTAVVDMVYRDPRIGGGAESTRLAREARARGCRTVDGRSVLLHQAFRQFLMMTGEELPRDLAREVLEIGEGGE